MFPGTAGSAAYPVGADVEADMADRPFRVRDVGPGRRADEQGEGRGCAVRTTMTSMFVAN